MEYIPEDLKALRDMNIEQTKEDIQDSIPHSHLILTGFRMLDDLKRVYNILMKRLEDWYGFYYPELTHGCDSHEKFFKLLEEPKRPKDSMGMDWDKGDFAAFHECVEEARGIQSTIEFQTEYIDQLMESHCPNIRAVTGSNIGAHLLALAGSLEKLARLPSSTIQLLGAEKSLFRHITTGARPPRHGILVHHPIVAKQKKTMRGKVARAIADKISVAARVDFFKGDYIGDKLKQDLEAKYG